MPGPGPRGRAALGLYLLVASAYLLTSPGRIDSIDGQLRYEVTHSLVETGRPTIRDPVLQRFGIRTSDGAVYAAYGIAPSLTPLPLVWLGSLWDGPREETRRFLFALADPLIGALIAPLLLVFFLELGIAPRSALAWTLASSFATLLWPASTTVLEQIQHAVLVLAAVYLGFLSGRRGSPVLAAGGGLAAGLLLLYQESYAILVPALALATLHGGRRGRSTPLGRLLVFLGTAGLGAVGWVEYNQLRFGVPLASGRLGGGGHPPLLGNPLEGLAALLISPGKGILFYSPLVVLTVVAFPAFRRRWPKLATTVAAATVVHGLFIASLSIFHGDWCWGPRYLTVLLPLWALPLPFLPPIRLRRPLIAALASVGLIVQLLGLSLVHERFFYERRLPTYFWYGDAAFYFRESALTARLGEIASTLAGGVPATATYFSPSPYRDLLTYYIAPPASVDRAPDWMPYFRIFYLPRPWPLWMPTVDPERFDRPLPPLPAAGILFLVGLAGGVLVWREGRRNGDGGSELGRKTAERLPAGDAALAAEDRELVPAVEPVEPSQEREVADAPPDPRLRAAPPEVPPGGDPAIGAGLRPQERGAPQQREGPGHDLGEQQDR